jgi:hypothetical protein
MKRDIFWAAILGYIFAIWMMNSPWSDVTKYREVIKACEKSLPRDQHCVVIGIPVSTD